MSLKDSILTDMKTAMREKNASQLESIRLLRAAIQRQEVDEQKELNEAEVLAIVQKQIKQSQDSIKLYQQGERPELAEKEHTHITHLQSYLPEQINEDDLLALIDGTIHKLGASSMQDMGKVMGALKPELQGRADMSKVSSLIKQKLT